MYAFYLTFNLYQLFHAAYGTAKQPCTLVIEKDEQIYWIKNILDSFTYTNQELPPPPLLSEEYVFIIFGSNNID
jgi:hypothetical protein